MAAQPPAAEPPEPQDALLEVRGLEAGYGRIRVLGGIDLGVARGGVTGILGHNGMGKSTLLKALMGHLPATAGAVRLAGADITRLPPHARARRGIGYVPQGRMIFPGLTVRENLGMGAAGRGRPKGTIEAVLADFPELRRLLDRPGAALSGGEQQLLSIARALCGLPRLLLLDEPSEGIQPSLVQAIALRLQTLRRSRGLTLLLVEQNLDLVRSLADRVFLIHRGRIARELDPATLETPDLIHDLVGMAPVR
jgi:urea ABC transporter ATP-binding protein UrtE